MRPPFALYLESVLPMQSSIKALGLCIVGFLLYVPFLSPADTGWCSWGRKLCSCWCRGGESARRPRDCGPGVEVRRLLMEAYGYQSPASPPGSRAVKRFEQCFIEAIGRAYWSRWAATASSGGSSEAYARLGRALLLQSTDGHYALFEVSDDKEMLCAAVRRDGVDQLAVKTVRGFAQEVLRHVGERCKGDSDAKPEEKGKQFFRRGVREGALNKCDLSKFHWEFGPVFVERSRTALTILPKKGVIQLPKIIFS